MSEPRVNRLDGDRILVCPECLTVQSDAGSGRAFCSGQAITFQHDEREMVGFQKDGLSGAVGSRTQTPPGSPAESDPQRPEDTERCSCKYEDVGTSIPLLCSDPNCPVHGRPERCPTCGSDDPVIRYTVSGSQSRLPGEPADQRISYRCPDPWHERPDA